MRSKDYPPDTAGRPDALARFTWGSSGLPTPLSFGGDSGIACLGYHHSTSRRGICSGQAKLGQQCADIPVGMDRDGSAIGVDLPDVESRDVEPATGGRDPRREPLAGVGAYHPPLLRHTAIGDIEERLTVRVKSQIGET
jgi:hypothetical protein